MDHMFALWHLTVFDGFAGNLIDIISNGFGQTCGVNRNNVRIIGGKNIVNGLYQIGLSAKNRGPLGK